MEDAGACLGECTRGSQMDGLVGVGKATLCLLSWWPILLSFIELVRLRLIALYPVRSMFLDVRVLDETKQSNSRLYYKGNNIRKDLITVDLKYKRLVDISTPSSTD